LFAVFLNRQISRNLFEPSIVLDLLPNIGRLTVEIVDRLPVLIDIFLDLVPDTSVLRQLFLPLQLGDTVKSAPPVEPVV
jgi:hypothetical protein